MNSFSTSVRNALFDSIDTMSQYCSIFVKNPEKDFIRKRKLDFATVLKMLLSMEGNSLKKELYDFFEYSTDTATVSAFVQQRGKIRHEALEILFHSFNEKFPEFKTYDEYRLLACDGSDINIPRNPNDDSTFFQSNSDEKGFNQLHLNALYDLCSRRYIDAIVQPGRQRNESSAMTDMIDRWQTDEKTIIMADRGYETYNIFAHAEKKGMNYLIRVKDRNSNGMLSGYTLPEQDEFDTEISLILTRKQTNEVKANPKLYKVVPKKSPFDYLDLHQNKFYPITFRVVRFKISEDTYESIITNLSKIDFPPNKIKELYHLRWGIETSFRELKYAIGLTHFHAKKVEYILQEIYARITMYNFCEIITTKVTVQQKSTKHVYQLNYTAAIHICRYFLKYRNDIHPPDVEALIQKNLSPVRPGRRDPRKVRAQKTVSFLYRVA
jgi:hypothetical protein